MVQPYSFQDELARMHAETARDAERSEGKAAYQRYLDYRVGQAVASDITGRVAASSRDAGDAAATLRAAARHQSIAVIRGELTKRASAYEAEVERQQPQRAADAELVALRSRIAREHAKRQGQVDRDWYRERER